jgi:opacity protein-like surface antigen
MKTLIILLLALTLVIPAYAGQAFVSYQSGSFNGDDDNLKENVLMHSVEAGYSWKNIELGAEVTTGKFKSNWTSSFRDSTAIATLKLKYPIKKLTAYAVAGVGRAWFTDKELTGARIERVPAETSMAYKYGLGAQYPITKKVNLFVEAVYRYSNTGKVADLDSWGWSYGGGVKVYF